MNQTERIKVIEGLLFASDTPISLQKLHEILEPEGMDKQDVKKGIAELARSLEEGGRALQVIEVAGGFRLVTRKELGPWIRKLSRPKKVRLSAAALEVLAIIAYKQPVTTPEIENIRGVNSSGVIKTLLERQLIKIAGRKDAVGNPIMYATTREFLEYFGLRSLRDMPSLKEFQEIMEEQGEALIEEAGEQGETSASETEEQSETSTDTVADKDLNAAHLSTNDNVEDQKEGAL